MDKKTAVTVKSLAHRLDKLMEDPEMRQKISVYCAKNDCFARNFQPRDSLEPAKHEITNLAWRQYPPLQYLLMKNKDMFFKNVLSNERSHDRIRFNKELTEKVKRKAEEHGWLTLQSDTVIRNKIRCFYKTLTQNAKKRILTAINNPQTKKSEEMLKNSESLIELWEEEYARRQSTIKDEIEEGSQKPLSSSHLRSQSILIESRHGGKTAPQERSNDFEPLQFASSKSMHDTNLLRNENNLTDVDRSATEDALTHFPVDKNWDDMELFDWLRSDENESEDNV